MKCEHINPKYRYVLMLSDRERIQHIHSAHWIGYDRAKEIEQYLVELLEYPKQPRMPNIIITGSPNSGKTTILQKFWDKYGQPWETEEYDLVVPFALIEAPNTASEKQFYMALIEAVGVPLKATSSVETLYLRSKNLYREFNVGMIVIDEFHSMFSGSPRKQRDMMNALKRLCNELQIPIVGAGTESATNILHTDKQFSSRFKVVELQDWKLDISFLKMLASFESILPLHKPSSLTDREIATKIHHKIGGNLGNLRNLLAQCAVASIRNGKEMIDVQAIMEADGYLTTTIGKI